MKSSRLAVLTLTGFTILGAAPGLGADPVELRPPLRAGDVHVLSLRVESATVASSRGATREQHETTRLEYTARVTVLAVDGSGRPLRERHDDVSLTFERPGERGSLFAEDVSYEVRRERAGEVEIFVGDARIARSTEKVIADLLAHRLEHGSGPEIFEPSGDVTVGDTWILDEDAIRRFLHAQGIRVIALGGPATATLERVAGERADRELVIRYRVPVGWCQWVEMPENATASSSHALLEGQIRLSADPMREPFAARSHLEMALRGVVTKPGVARPFPWKMQTTKAVDQRTVRMPAEVASR